MLRKKMAFIFLLAVSTGCTTRYQVRGTEVAVESIDLIKDLVGESPENRALQISLEHQSVEEYNGYTLGILEISDEGNINPFQKAQVMDMVRERTKNGGLLFIFVHGWHHGARVCDRDLCCFRAVLNRLNQAQLAQKGTSPSQIVGLYIGWRGESLARAKVNVATLWDRKRTAEHIGRTAGKEILSELHDHWTGIEDLTMLTVGHSLGGAFVFSAVKGKLTGNVSDILQNRVRTYRVVRADSDRREALDRKVKALRAGFGDLVVLVNPAIEASEYQMFHDDLIDNEAPTDRQKLIDMQLPYDKAHPYDPRQLPVLMTIASEADTAVGRFFPPARVLGDLATFRWSHLASKAQRTGMGRFAPHVTHRLDYAGEIQRDRGTVAKDCGCPMVSKGDVDLGEEPLELDLPRAKTYGKLTFGPTAERVARGWDANSPYLVVEVTKRVIDEHNDIFNPIVVDFLSKFIDAYVTKYEEFDVEEDIARIRAVDTQFHGNVRQPPDDGTVPPPVGSLMYPAQLTLEHKDYIAAWQSIYGYKPARGETVGDHVRAEIKARAYDSRGDGYSTWVLDRVGVDFALIEDESEYRQGFSRGRFLLIPNASALLFAPFDSAQAEPLLRSRGLERLPGSLTEFLDQVMIPTLEAWKRGDAVAVKVALTYEKPPEVLTAADAERAYDTLLGGVAISGAESLGLTDFLLRQLAREAGRAGLVVHIHQLAPYVFGRVEFDKADPRLLASILEDPALGATRFVLVQGGWPFEIQTCELLKKPNVYAQISQLTLRRLVRERNRAVRHWLEEHPEKVLFGTDAAADAEVPLGGWEESEWLLVRAGREALASTLGILVAERRITKEAAVKVAGMVLRDNALQLYQLHQN